MRFLANENFPSAAVTALEAAGHEVIWARIAAPGMTDFGHASGSNLTFESWKGFPSGSLHASLAHANRNFDFSQAC